MVIIHTHSKGPGKPAEAVKAVKVMVAAEMIAISPHEICVV